jgi:hypothetical protein
MKVEKWWCHVWVKGEEELPNAQPPNLEAHALCLGAGDDSGHNVGKDAAAGLLAKVPNAAAAFQGR